MPRVIHFEIQSDDLETSADFYSNVFDWVITKKQTQDYWLVRTGSQDERGINGGMAKRQKKNVGTIPTIDVDSVDQYAKKVLENGGKVTRPKFNLPGTGYLAYCEDPEGNPFAILQYDSASK
jgi:uncharacterized protein